jgi:long-chain acyl-CoA synthetase
MIWIKLLTIYILKNFCIKECTVTEKPWLKFYDPEVPPAVDYDGSTIPSLLEKSIAVFGRQNAVDFFGFTMTYAELREAIEQFTRVLHSLGLGKGERVALFLPNCPHFIIAYYAALRLGAVIVPTNPLYSEKELEFQIRDSGAETLVTLDLLYPKVYKVQPSVGLKRIIVGKIQDYLPPLKKFIYPIIAQKGTENVPLEEKNGVMFYHRLMKSKAPDCPLPKLSGEDLAILQYTGGTTGSAKGAMLTHKNIVINNTMIRHWYTGLRPGKEIFIAVLPFFHTYGMATALNLPLSAGASIVLFPKFVAKDILKAIDSHKATVLPGIPTIYSVLGNFRDIGSYNVSTIRYCISGAAPLPGTVLKDFESLTGGIIIEGYGLSEASPVTHCNPLKGTRKDGSIGMPVPDTDCKIVDMETGEDLPLGSTGELCIKGPQVMQGYWNRPEETAATLRNGWLYTGDIARMDEDGYFFIVERKKDMIISEGFNIYPREIEEFLLTHPKVADASVIGMPDKIRGERVYAFVVLKEGVAATPEEIVRFCKEHLVRYKVPRKVLFRDSIPRNLAGKNLRRVLREEAAALAAADDEREDTQQAEQ